MQQSLAPRQAQLARAIAELNAGNAALAAEICAQLVREAPEDPAVHQLLATIAFRMDRLADAEQHVATSLAHRSKHGPTWLLAGRIAQARGDLAEAGVRFERAVALDPAREDAAFALCLVRIELASRGELDPAGSPGPAELIDSLLSRFPDFAPGWAAMSVDLERLGQWDAALVAAARSAKAAPSVAGHLRCARLALRLSRRPVAADALRQALDLDPTLAPVWFKLGVVLQDCHDPSGAMDAYRRALALDGDLAEAATNLGILLQEDGEIDAAKRAYGQALRARGDSFGRISQALTAAPRGELWLDLAALRAHLLACAS